MNYRPRSDFVLFRGVNKGAVGSVAMPDRAAEGKERVVEAVGPDVLKDSLKVGDKILVIGTLGSDTVEVPGERALYMTRQANVALIVED